MVRARWEDRLAQVGVAALHAELSRVDPAAGASILPTDGRRIVRALEVVELTGKDVVRHRIVADIVNAYERDAADRPAPEGRGARTVRERHRG